MLSVAEGFNNYIGMFCIRLSFFWNMIKILFWEALAAKILEFIINSVSLKCFNDVDMILQHDLLGAPSLKWRGQNGTGNLALIKIRSHVRNLQPHRNVLSVSVGLRKIDNVPGYCWEFNISDLIVVGNMNPVETGDCDDKFHAIIYLWSTFISRPETILQYFLVILKRMYQNSIYKLKNIEKNVSLLLHA